VARRGNAWLLPNLIGGAYVTGAGWMFLTGALWQFLPITAAVAVIYVGAKVLNSDEQPKRSKKRDDDH